MHYIYMNNFRGFSNTVIPLTQVSFLVGENSTGKSSFLKLANLFMNSEFFNFPEKTLQNDANFGWFSDMVSAWATDRTTFEVGIFAIEENKLFELEYFVFGRSNRGEATLKEYIAYARGVLYRLSIENGLIKSNFIDHDFELVDSESILLPMDFLTSTIQYAKKMKGKVEIKDMMSSITHLPLPFCLYVINEQSPKQKSKNKKEWRLLAFPSYEKMVSIAPIRNKPERFYGLNIITGYSPEGAHTPYALSMILEGKRKDHFEEKLATFGKESGLFETIVTHRFGSHEEAPFEILVKFNDNITLNLNNVGYGVSQILPIIVEMLSEDGKNVLFAVQQPEVHLHPKAQSALGDLIAEQARYKKQSFLIETHSDYILDRFRYNLSKNQGPDDTLDSQVLFFERCDKGNNVTVIPISKNGKYPDEQPIEFKDFFIKEELRLLEI